MTAPFSPLTIANTIAAGPGPGNTDRRVLAQFTAHESGDGRRIVGRSHGPQSGQRDHRVDPSRYFG